MKTAAGVLIIAIVLVAAGIIGLSQAQSMRQLVNDQQRLATLHYTNEAAAGAGAMNVLLSRVSLPFISSGAADNEKATMNYWQARYETLAPLAGGTSGQGKTNDPNVLLIAANAAFRATHQEDGKAAVGQLDAVMQSYGDVLRADPNNLDASYNYEYVARLRDAIAKGKPPKKEQTVALSTDLPVGPTLHGRPGGPPPEVAMKDFKTVSPLENDERGEQIEVGRRPVQRKRG